MTLAPATTPIALVDAARLRIAITGAPRTGKTTMAYDLASRLGDRPRVLSTDNYRHLEWSAASLAVAAVMSEPGWSGIVEGVAVPRVLRKMLRADPTRRPIDRLIILETVHEPLSTGQLAMAKGLMTVLTGPVDGPGSPRVADALRGLGVAIDFPHHQGA